MVYDFDSIYDSIRDKKFNRDELTNLFNIDNYNYYNIKKIEEEKRIIEIKKNQQQEQQEKEQKEQKNIENYYKNIMNFINEKKIKDNSILYIYDSEFIDMNNRLYITKHIIFYSKDTLKFFIKYDWNPDKNIIDIKDSIKLLIKGSNKDAFNHMITNINNQINNNNNKNYIDEINKLTKEYYSKYITEKEPKAMEVKTKEGKSRLSQLINRFKKKKGGKKIKTYKLNGEKVEIVHNKKKVTRSIYEKEGGKTRYCKIDSEYIPYSKCKKPKK